jgi:hypothetical protein
MLLILFPIYTTPPARHQMRRVDLYYRKSLTKRFFGNSSLIAGLVMVKHLRLLGRTRKKIAQTKSA